jgi:hypothetical protein
MIELNLSVYTNQNSEHKVTLAAGFATHEDAVRFHEGLAALCRNSSSPRSIPWSHQLLQWRAAREIERPT